MEVSMYFKQQRQTKKFKRLLLPAIQRFLHVPSQILKTTRFKKKLDNFFEKNNVQNKTLEMKFLETYKMYFGTNFWECI